MELVQNIVELYPELIDEQSLIYWTPVMIACRYGYLDIAKFLY
jgi:hypothetical protein